MIVGIPKEIKPDEARVAIVPSGVAAFVAHGHSVLVEKNAGIGSGIPDDAYRSAGAKILSRAKDIWAQADLVMKVKEPLDAEFRWMKPNQILFTFLHLASNMSLTKMLLKKKVTAIGYETIQLQDGVLPALFPMSEVAGRLSIQKGAQCLEAGSKGRGILLGGVSGVKPAKVVILGGGVAGLNACQMAVGVGANVTVIDVNHSRLRYLHELMGGRIATAMSNRATVTEEVTGADLVIGCALIPGARTPRLITKEMVKQMKPGAAIVDIAIDQGGCCETSHPTTHHDPIYHVHGVVHYCVSNMPGAVPRTATYALTNITLGYGLALADKGVEKAIKGDPALKLGLNAQHGFVTHQAVAEALTLPWHEV